MNRLIRYFITAAICSSMSKASAAELELVEDEDVIRITLRGNPVLEYVKAEKPVPQGIEPHYRRSGYIHPVYSPTGEEVTGDFPADHAHQHALFLAWTKVTYDGRSADFWNQGKDLGRIEFRDVLNVERKARQVSFSVKHAFTLGSGKDKLDILHEIWKVTVYETPDDHFLFDVESVQECATAKPFILEEFHYGGMSFRGNFQWLKEPDDHSIHPGDVVYLTSEGKDRWEGNHSRPNWVAFTGKIDKQDVSAAVFCSPKNFRAPQAVRIHPNKPYFCFAPMVDGQFKIEPGEKYVSHYRYLVTSEALNLNKIQKHWQTYVKEKL